MHYSIGEFARLCGINATTLRAWQRRYGLLKPQRSDGGHRLYSDEDIRQALNILEWLKKGVPISKVKILLDRPEEQYTNQWLSLQERLLQQLTAGRIDAARSIIYDSGRDYPREELVTQLLRPLRRKISANIATTITLRAILDGLIIAYTAFCIEGDKKTSGAHYLISGWYLTDACEVWLEALQRTGQHKRLDVLPHLPSMLAPDMFPDHHWILVTAEKLTLAEIKQTEEWQEKVRSLEIIQL